MRMPESKIRDAILHPEKLVRDEALSYFAESFSRDPEVMPVAIQAIEMFGRNDALRAVYSLRNLVQSEATVDWLIREMNIELGSMLEHENYLAHLSRVLCNSDPQLLVARSEEIAKSPGFAPSCHAELQGRIERATWDADRCWKELNELAAALDDDSTFNRLFAHSEWTIDALARLPECDGDRVLDVLAQPITDFDKNPMVWLELFAARLAGEMRLHRAIPLLVPKLREDGDYLLEETTDSLGKIGTDAAAEAITANWSNETWDFRLFATSALEKIHTDTTVRECLRLLPDDPEIDIRTKLADALLAQYDESAIEPVREMVRTKSYDSSMLDLSGRLVAVSTILGVTFPELATWKRRAEEENARLERRMKEFDRVVRIPSAPPAKPKSKPRAVERLAPVVPAGPRVGRNEPCPCGSGKKYKVCCLRK